MVMKSLSDWQTLGFEQIGGNRFIYAPNAKYAKPYAKYADVALMASKPQGLRRAALVTSLVH